MKINSNLLPIKSHFFMYWGFMASAPPFLMVVARQVGVPLGIQGLVSALVTFSAFFMRPLIGALADTFPRWRKIIFLGLIAIMIAAYNPICFLPSLHPAPHIIGHVISSNSFPHNPDIRISPRFLFVVSQQDQLSLGECVVTSAWDCVPLCQELCQPSMHKRSGFKLSLHISQDELGLKQIKKMSTLSPLVNGNSSNIRRYQKLLKNQEREEDKSEETWSLKENDTMVYTIEGVYEWSNCEIFNISLECENGIYKNTAGYMEDCSQAVWSQPTFWAYVVLLLIGFVASTTVDSISDAICCDTIGVDGDYGRQRVWGVVSYGLVGILSGILVDWRSGDNNIRDYRAAFLLMTICGVVDFLLSARWLKVPTLKDQRRSVKANLSSLFHQMPFLAFLFTVFMIGLFDGLDTGFLFVLQEDIAKGVGKTGQNVNMVQGLTLFVQSLSAIPCMFMCDWFMHKLGALKIINTVIFLYSIRLLALATGSYFSILWLTVLVEVINGPCFGFGYTAIIIYASKLSPRSLTTTVQSIVGVCYSTLGYASASFVGGVIYEDLGGQWLYFITGMAALLIWALHLSYITLCLVDIKGQHFEEKGKLSQEESPHEMLGLASSSFYIKSKEEGAEEITL